MTLTQEPSTVRRQLRASVAIVLVLVVAAAALLTTRGGDDDEGRLSDAVDATLAWMRAGQGCDDWFRYSDTTAGRTLCERSTDHTVRSVELVTSEHRSGNGARCAVAKVELEGADGRTTWAFARSVGSDRWAFTGGWNGLRSVVCGGVA